MHPNGHAPARRNGRLYPDPNELTDWDDILRHDTMYLLEQASLQARASLTRARSHRRAVARSTSTSDRGTLQPGLDQTRRSVSSRCLPASQSMSNRSFDSARTASYTDELTVGTNLSEPVTIASSQDNSCVGMNPMPSSSASKPKPLAATASPNSDDRVDHLFGKQVNIKGASHVYNDILEGNAILVQCPVCSSCAQVGRQTKLFLCPVCKSISRAAPAQAHSTEQDGEIAASVQNQEADVARARLRAKLEANRNNAA